MLKHISLILIALSIAACHSTSSIHKNKLSSNDPTTQPLSQGQKYRAAAKIARPQADLALVYVVNPYYINMANNAVEDALMPFHAELVQSIRNGKKWIISDQSVRDMTLYTNAFHCFYIRPGNYTFNTDITTKGITKPTGFQSHAALPLLLEPHSTTYVANRLFFNYACENGEECFYTAPVVVNKTVAKNYIGIAMYWAKMYNTRSDNIVTYYPITNQSAITGNCPILN